MKWLLLALLPAVLAAQDMRPHVLRRSCAGWTLGARTVYLPNLGTQRAALLLVTTGVRFW
jgi:hypothetical protein